jgi:hypothetical protein
MPQLPGSMQLLSLINTEAKKLQSLSIITKHTWGCFPKTFSFSKGLTNLTSLELSGYKHITPTTIASMAKLPSLQALRLSRLGYYSITSFSPLTNTSSLALTHRSLQSKSSTTLSHLSNLKSLDLTGTHNVKWHEDDPFEDFKQDRFFLSDRAYKFEPVRGLHED